MIESADEFRRLHDSDDADEKRRIWHEEAATSTWRDVITRFPELRRQVAKNQSVPYEVLAELRNDPDASVQWAVRSREAWVKVHPEDARPWTDDPSQVIHVGLSDDERSFLRWGLVEWGGPARCTEEFARAMGFDSVRDLHEVGHRLSGVVERGEPMGRIDWVRALLATEVVFASNVVGSGLDWEVTSGFTDAESIKLLRALQRKLPTSGVIGLALGTRPVGGP